MIITTCKSSKLTLEQIALVVNRSPAYLQNKVLPDLVKSGKLIRQFPDNPNNPNQAYIAADDNAS